MLLCGRSRKLNVTGASGPLNRGWDWDIWSSPVAICFIVSTVNDRGGPSFKRMPPNNVQPLKIPTKPLVSE